MGMETSLRRKRPSRAFGAALIAALVVVVAGTVPALALRAALADGGWRSSPITDASPDELQVRIERSAAAYNEAVARVEDLEERAGSCRAAIERLRADLPAAQDAAYDAIRSDYKLRLNRGTLVDLIVSADDFESFISMVAYLDSVERYNAGRIDALVELQGRLDEQDAQLSAALMEARAQKASAESALQEAIAARQEAQRIAAERAAEAARAAQGASARQERPPVAAGAAEGGAQPGDLPSTEGSQADEVPSEQAMPEAGGDLSMAAEDVGGAGPAEEGASSSQVDAPPPADVLVDLSLETSPEASDTDAAGPAAQAPVDAAAQVEASAGQEAAEAPADVDWSSDKAAFVDEWGSRIDDYLSNGELAGYGSTFASAAWDYGVDPRWSPAISTIESSQGAACFLPHNAWGWGSSSWDSWEEAIYDQVEGLARGYGSTLDYEDAQRYCPPTADEWYDAVSGQMEQI